MKYLTKLGELIRNKVNWAELKDSLSEHNTSIENFGVKNTIAGKLFEYFAKYYFLVETKVCSEYTNVWLFNEIPLQIKKELNIDHADYGIDLLIKDRNNAYIAVQCKFKNDESEKLGWSKDKIGNFFGYANCIQKLIIFSNASEIDDVIKTRTDQLCFISIKDLVEIDEVTFRNIYNCIFNLQIMSFQKASPYEFQKEVITRAEGYLKFHDRGKIILPCGTGKTLISLWIKERILPNRCLVLFPSLALLRQTKNEWIKNRNIDFKYIIVCSENDINEEYDYNNINLYDLDSFVTTDSKMIHDFLTEKTNPTNKVIFSTYQSLSKISDAISGTDISIDLAICDEAHKTAGFNNSLFSQVHNDENIKIHKRLYMTATPRVYSNTIKKNMYDENVTLYDMSDIQIYGQEIFRMTFSEAIELGILVDYQIVCIGVRDDEIQKMVEERYLIDNSHTITDFAGNYALKMIFEEYDVHHAITFHSKIKYAEEFSNRSKKILPTINSFFVSGQHSTNRRTVIMNDFKNSQKAIISNARCLTEGVDVPLIDAVFFCDPKNSKIDIVQAAGRALRKNSKNPQKIGRIIIPVFHKRSENVENAIDKSIFKNVIQVVRSLADHDERLQNEINEIVYNKGKKRGVSEHLKFLDYRNVNSLIQIEHMEDILRSSFFNEILEKNSTTWDLYYLELKDHILQYGHLPKADENSGLYNWVSAQRLKNKQGEISIERILKLEELGFIWDLQDDSWNILYEQVLEHNMNNQYEPDERNFPELFRWLQTQKQRIKAKKLRSDRYLKIENFKYLGTAIDKQWDDNLNELIAFHKENPKSWPKQRNSTGIEHKLAVWMLKIGREYRDGSIREDRFEKLLNIGYVFEDRKWLSSFQKVKGFIDINHCFPDFSEESSENNLWLWLKNQYNSFHDNSMATSKIHQLKSIQFEEFKIIEPDKWDDVFDSVLNYYLEYNTLPGYNEIIGKNKKIVYGSWGSNQRIAYKKGILQNIQIEKLSEIGFVFDTEGSFQQKWDHKFKKLKKWVFLNNGRWPGNNLSEDPEEKELSNFVNSNRSWHNGNLKKYGDYPNERKLKLESIGFVWETKRKPFGKDSEKLWETNYNLAKNQVEIYGKIPFEIEGKTNHVYTWLTNQRSAFKNNILSEDRQSRLDKVGLVYKSQDEDREHEWNRYYEECRDQISKFGKLPTSINGSKNQPYYWFYRQNKLIAKKSLSQEKIEKIINLTTSST